MELVKKALGIGLTLALLAGALLLRTKALGPTPASSPAPGAAAPPSSPAPSPSSVRVVVGRRTVEATPELGAELDGFLAQIPVEARRDPRQLLREALARQTGPLDYRKALDQVLKQQPGAAQAAAELLAAGMDQVDEELRFQHALSLSHHLDEAASATLLARLDGPPSPARPLAVFALRGSRDPQVDARLAQLYVEDAQPEARVQAAFVLAEHARRLDPLLVERARGAARLDLAGEDPQLYPASADVLGIPPLSEGDQRLLLRTLERGSGTSRRKAALRALASAKASPAVVVPALERLAADEGTDAELRALAQAALKQARGE